MQKPLYHDHVGSPLDSEKNLARYQGAVGHAQYQFLHRGHRLEVFFLVEPTVAPRYGAYK